MLSSFQHPRSSIFLSLEQVTLPLACVHTPAPPSSNNTAQDKHGLQLRWPSAEQKRTLPLKSLLYPGRTKRRLHLRTVPTIRPWPGPFYFIFLSPPLSPPANTLTGFFQHGVVGVWGMPFMLTCVHAARLCQTCPLHNSCAKRLTSNFWHIHPPHWVSMGGKSHVHLYARGIHSESVKINWDWAILNEKNLTKQSDLYL